MVVCGGCGFAECWSFPDVEAPLGNHSANSPASVCVVSPGPAMSHCKVKSMLCSMQKLWGSLRWGMLPALGDATARAGRWFVGCVVLVNANAFQM